MLIPPPTLTMVYSTCFGVSVLRAAAVLESALPGSGKVSCGMEGQRRTFLWDMGPPVWCPDRQPAEERPLCSGKYEGVLWGATLRGAATRMRSQEPQE